ncbi:MAG: hypothetical protein B6I28_05865 [Fusobacteriia bacterium 4572_132]|nr:MAG: hypothetical protein B6I28_05865 [Fusobacteriia bacterium 4572_132]
MDKNTVLLVDDTSYIIYYFEKILMDKVFKKFNLEVIGSAKNGLEAIKFHKKEKPLITFMDISMPNMNGLEALAEIKKIKKEAIVIFVTALGNKDKVIEAVQLGAAGYILKPFKKEQILDILEKLKNKGELK